MAHWVACVQRSGSPTGLTPVSYHSDHTYESDGASASGTLHDITEIEKELPFFQNLQPDRYGNGGLCGS